MPKNLGIPKKENTVLLIIDIQDKFIPVIKNLKRVIENSKKLINSFKIMKVPIMVTQQYTKGLGNTVKPLRELLKNTTAIEKTSFNCFDNKGFFNELKKLKVKNLVIAGIESHICVMQTALAAISKGYNVHLVIDATSSRKKQDYKTAIERAKKAGAFLTTTEMIIFQLLKKASTEKFKKILKIVK